jgi:hypothetical protein
MHIYVYVVYKENGGCKKKDFYSFLVVIFVIPDPV